MSGTNDKTMFKGDHRTFELQATKESDESAVDLTSDSLIFTTKVEATDTVAVIEKSSTIPTEIDITDPTGGIAEIYLVPADTQDLDARSYVYDVQFTSSAGKVSTLLKGTLTLLQDVTN